MNVVLCGLLLGGVHLPDGAVAVAAAGGVGAGGVGD